MQEYIWEPLEMDSTTFRLADRPDIAARIPKCFYDLLQAH